jgi:hypothetical protein
VRRFLAVAYLMLGVVLGAYAFADPMWGIPGCLLLGGWLIFVGVRCLGRGEVASLVRRTAFVFLAIFAASVALMVWTRVQGTGASTGALAAWISFPVFLGTTSCAVALLSWAGLRMLGR